MRMNNYAGIQNYRFIDEVNCSEANYDYQHSATLIAFVIGLNCVQLVLTVMGVALNSLSFAVLAKSACRSDITWLLKHLAVPDTLYVVANCLDNICHTLQLAGGRSRQFYANLAYMHSPVWTLRVLMALVHNWMMLLVALSRVLKIYLPMRSQAVSIRKHLKFTTAVIWIAGLMLSLPRFTEVNMLVANCSEAGVFGEIATTKLTKVYSGLVNFGLQIGGPLLAACVCNGFTILGVRRSARGVPAEGEQLRENRQHAARRSYQATRTVLMLTNLYIVCQIPQLAWGIITLTTLAPGPYVLLVLFSNAIGSLDGSCNFFIYLSSNPKFRRSLKGALLWRLGQRSERRYGNKNESSAFVSRQQTTTVLPMRTLAPGRSAIETVGV